MAMPLLNVVITLSPGILAGETNISIYLAAFLSLVAFAYTRFNDLTTRELLARCVEFGNDRERYWQEFRARFDAAMALYIYREFRQLCGDATANRAQETILDLRQDAYIRLLKNDGEALRRFRGETEQSFRAFLYIVCRNIVRNYVRTKVSREKRQTSFVAAADRGSGDSIEIEPPSQETLEQIEAAELAAHCVDMLKQNYNSREIHRDIAIFKLYYFQRYTSKELVEFYNFGLSSSGIETLMSRMKQSLKREL